MTADDQQPKSPKSGASSRLFRRLRRQFRQELLGDDKPTPSDRTLIEQAALVALRTREMRDTITAGEQIEDEDFVRLVRATASVMKTFREHRFAKQKSMPTLLKRRLALKGSTAT